MVMGWESGQGHPQYWSSVKKNKYANLHRNITTEDDKNGVLPSTWTYYGCPFLTVVNIHSYMWTNLLKNKPSRPFTTKRLANKRICTHFYFCQFCSISNQNKRMGLILVGVSRFYLFFSFSLSPSVSFSSSLIIVAYKIIIDTYIIMCLVVIYHKSM